MVEVATYSSSILCIILILGFSSYFELKRIKPTAKYEIKNQDENNQPIEQPSVPKKPLVEEAKEKSRFDEYPDDPDEYEVEEIGPLETKNEKLTNIKEMNSDILVNGKAEFDIIIIPFQLVTCTFLALFLTSDNPEEYDNHIYNGF